MIPEPEMDIELLISQYIDGELTSDAEADLHHRLAVSPEARSLFRAQLALRGVARDARVLATPTTDLRSRLFDRLQQEGFTPEALPSSITPIAAPTAVVAHSIPSPRVAGTDRRRRRRAIAWALVPILFLVAVIGNELFLKENLQKGMPIADDYGPTASNARPGELPSAGTQSQPSITDAGRDVRDHAMGSTSATAPPTAAGEASEALPRGGSFRSTDQQASEPETVTAPRRRVTTVASAREEIADGAGSNADFDARALGGRSMSSSAPPATVSPALGVRAATPTSSPDRVDDALQPPPALARHRASASLSEGLPDDEVMSRDGLRPTVLGANERGDSESIVADGGGSAAAEGSDKPSFSTEFANGEMQLSSVGNLRGTYATAQLQDSTRGESLTQSQEDVPVAAINETAPLSSTSATALTTSGPSIGADADANLNKEKLEPKPLDPPMMEAAQAACENVSASMKSASKKPEGVE